MKEYTKNEIINKLLTLPNIMDVKVISERAWLDRLNESLQFLKVDEILNGKDISDSSYYFFQKNINLIHREVTKPRIAHYFEPLAAIILIAFLAQYEHPFTKKYIKGKLPDRKEAEQWFSNIEEIILQLVGGSLCR